MVIFLITLLMSSIIFIIIAYKMIDEEFIKIEEELEEKNKVIVEKDKEITELIDKCYKLELKLETPPIDKNHISIFNEEKLVIDENGKILYKIKGKIK